ncbi:MAG: hypothetical protein OXB86_04675 [Bdellovibrionales bacterium]|nr:hypothetical protein [Bdellovibrionales bacterium]
MLKLFLGILLASGFFGVTAYSAENSAEIGEILSKNTKIIMNYYPFKGEPSLFGESMFSEQQVKCREVAFDINLIKEQIPGWRNLVDLTGFNEDMTTESVFTPVSGAWMQFGLTVGNTLAKEGNYTLVIDRLNVIAQGKHEEKVFNYSKTLSAGYCGAPFLYIVTAGNVVEYQPFSENSLENLTLYLDNIPVEEKVEKNQSVKIMPAYSKMEVTFMGWFVSEDGTKVEPFLKKKYISTRGSRFVQQPDSSWVRVPSP